MIEISNVQIYGYDEAIIYSGLSYSDDPEYSMKRALKLAKASICSGHDSFLKGITVQFTLKAPHYFIIEMQRYHFIDIIMSTSKMHMLSNDDWFWDNMPIELDDEIRSALFSLYEQWRDNPNELNFRKLLSNMPLGFTLKMRMITNYLQLKNIYYQRNKHKLEEWREFCGWIKSLPLLKEALN